MGRKKATATSSRGPWICLECGFYHAGALVSVMSCTKCDADQAAPKPAATETYYSGTVTPKPCVPSSHAATEGRVPQVAVSCRAVTAAAPPSEEAASAVGSEDLSDNLLSLCDGETGSKIVPGHGVTSRAVMRDAAREANQDIESVIYSEFVWHAPTKHCPRLCREEIQHDIADARFGQRLCGKSSRAAFYNRIAALAVTSPVQKQTDIVSKLWAVEGDRWLQQKVNLEPRQRRRAFRCIPNVYDYSSVPARTMVVDFANKKVGGGCFGGGFVQEEQMVTQSMDFAVRLHKHRQTLAQHQAVSYEGVHMDAWWDREAAAMKEHLDTWRIQHRQSAPLTIFAIDAPVMRGQQSYQQWSLHMLAKKLTLAFAVASELEAPLILSGLLGGGAFRGNRPLILLLRLLLQPFGDKQPVCFHYPVFWSFGNMDAQQLEQQLLVSADVLIEEMRKQNVETLDQALKIILTFGLALSEGDRDLVAQPEHQK
eukprot:TRINITY_DN27373_c0_g1_i1.p1 TRINITY_DN27373_c0_g1~~TRINITY_DN27373_c0_g1_i1.p1  ORF type:complete len:483 (-),score=74.66 TRINITY_DN27373_c0_g1_i1:110-1558(-)